MLTSAKLRALELKGNFVELYMFLYLRTKVSSRTITSFRQGVILHLHPPQNELLKSPSILGLNAIFP